ncbi:MAG TPA: SAM-dependent methyltransferase [Solirubrobacteraceae bacterium]|jgi:methyltransferase (TIGR00027 family)|nr:SAM-dependent methyltransferase [Solirubrobacteraceae bacterium]
MDDGKPSATAQRVAAYRVGFDRLPASFGDPSADDRLARDVAGSATAEPNQAMARYLRARTSFFDRVVVNGLDRGVTQIVAVGAGYDGRSLRYAKPGVRWFEVDHPDTQRDKRARVERLGIDASQVAFVAVDLESGGLAAGLVDAGYEPDRPSVVLCEGVAVYLAQPTLEALLRDLRIVATVGTRLAISLSSAPTSADESARRARFQATVAGLGEPARTTLTANDASDLLTSTRWRATDLSERAGRAGFVVAAPIWAPDARAGPTASRVGVFMERMYHRSATDRLPAHLERVYGIQVARIDELDVGVFRVDQHSRPSWVARVFQAARPPEAAERDAQILRGLERIGFPAERCAHPEPVSTHDGQAVLVTEFLAGRKPAARPRTFRALGDLLGRLHTLPAGPASTARPGGAWHHLALEGGPRDELAAAGALLDDARRRVRSEHHALYETLRQALARADDCHDLPHALTHPDFVHANAVAGPDGEIAMIDWTGAGRGPRLSSVGFLLWAAGTRPCIDAAVAGYRAHVSLEPDELDRLGPAIGARPIVFDCWGFATGRERLPDVVNRLEDRRARVETIAARARAAFERASA